MCIYRARQSGRYAPLNIVTYTLLREYPENRDKIHAQCGHAAFTHEYGFLCMKLSGWVSWFPVVRARTATHLLVLYRSDRSSFPGTPSASCRSGSVSPSTRHPPEPGPGCGPCGAAAGAGNEGCPGSSVVRWDSDGFVKRWQLPHLPD